MAEFGWLIFIIVFFIAMNLSIWDEEYPLDWVYKILNMLGVVVILRDWYVISILCFWIALMIKLYYNKE